MPSINYKIRSLVILLFLAILPFSSLASADQVSLNPLTTTVNFTGKFFVSNNPHFRSIWANTPGTYTHTINTAQRFYTDETVDLQLFLANMAMNADNEWNVTYDLQILGPTGNEHFARKGIQAFAGKIPPGLNLANFKLVKPYLWKGFVAGDIYGKYQVNITVYDNISHQKLSFAESIELMPYGLDRRELGADEIVALLTTYYQRPDAHIIFELIDILDIYGEHDKILPLIMVPTFTELFKDNEYLIPYFVDHFNNIEYKRHEVLLPILKGIAFEHIEVLDQTFLITDEVKALNLYRIPNIWDDKFEYAVEIDMLWASFFVTGEIEAVKQVLTAIRLHQGKDGNPAVLKAATWGIENYSKQHPLVRAYCETLSKQEQDPYIRAILEKILLK